MSLQVREYSELVECMSGFSCYHDTVLVMPFKTGRVWFDSQMKVQLFTLGRGGMEVKAAVVLVTIASTVRKRGSEDWCSAHFVLFLFSFSPRCLHSSFNISVNILTDTPRRMFPR